MRIPLTALLLLATATAQQPPKSDPKAPENAARQAVVDSLDTLAAKQTAVRRTEIALIKTRAQAEARQTKVRATMLRLLGPLPEKTPLNPQILGETQLDGFRIQKIVFESQPKFYVTALLYLPNISTATERLPGIVMAPGHGATGKAGDFASAAAFARNGFAVLSYDPIGQGERLQYPDPADPSKSLATRPTGEHAEASLQPMLIGESVAKYFLWDGIRAVDYLLTRPEIDAHRIGAYGCSGGGAMTALLGALDPRIAAVGTACYITSFDSLLPAIGPQDGEQSTPGWIAAGLDFPDWVELAAPKPYAIIATASDMFPYAGARASAAEARRFYALFNPINAGTLLSSRSAAEGSASAPPITAPTLNPDTDNTVSPTAALQFIVGPGGHGNLRPLLPDILRFFLIHLAYSNAPPKIPGAPSRSASSNEVGATNPQGREVPPSGALQVTTTGQVSSAYPGAATVFSLNLAHAKTLAPLHPLLLPKFQATIREVTGTVAGPGTFHAPLDFADAGSDGTFTTTNPHFQSEPGIGFGVWFNFPNNPGRHPAILKLVDAIPYSKPASAIGERLIALSQAGNVVLVLPSRPTPPGTEEQKTPLLGEFYMLGLRAELIGKTILGMRADDVIRAVDALAADPHVDPNNLTAEASGHEALVLLHAAVLDPRLKHITVTNLPPNYRDILANPLPKDAPEDLIPGVLLHYDIPDLLRALGSRVTVVAPDNPSPSPNL
jgi:dienelactone hydrolase